MDFVIGGIYTMFVLIIGMAIGRSTTTKKSEDI